MANNANESNVFTVRGLHFAYDHGRVPIFDGLDVTIPEGRITTLIGANGSGKSTLFNLLTKNLKPTGGTVHLRGGDLTIRYTDETVFMTGAATTVFKGEIEI